MKALQWVAVGMLGISLACGGGGGTVPTQPTTPSITVSISPSTLSSLPVNGAVTFAATVSGSSNKAVNWAVQEGAGGGTITASGLYTAPAASGAYHVLATSAADSNAKATATVTVTAVSPRQISLVAGSTGGPGSADGQGNAAQFNFPKGIARDGAENVYVTEARSHTIRKITPAGVVSTLAGSVGNPGWADGPGIEAKFNAPLGVAVDSSGNVFVVDSANHIIRKIDPSGTVSTFAGAVGQGGQVDGPPGSARFDYPGALAFDLAGNLYLADYGTLRKITPEGVVSTLAGTPSQRGYVDGSGASVRFGGISGLVPDAGGNVYVADYGNLVIRKVSPSGVVSTWVATPVGGMAMDGSGNFYGTWNDGIKKIDSLGTVSLLAGGNQGQSDGIGPDAEFNAPGSLVLDGNGNLFVADSGNNTIRKVTLAGEVTTFAGPINHKGYLEGTGPGARFDFPEGVAVDGAGNTYVADSLNQVIRKITPSGQTSLVAGVPRFPGFRDGTGSGALFNYPEGVAVDVAGNVFIADSGNHVIRKIALDGTVSTLAGSPGNKGKADGAGNQARFNTPTGIALDGAGSVYVVDSNNGILRKISPEGTVTTLAEVPSHGIAVDTTGNVYVTDAYVIRKIASNGSIQVIAGTTYQTDRIDGMGAEARFWNPNGIAVDTSGRLYVTDHDNHTIRMITPDGMVSTIAGRPGVPGISEGAPGGLAYPTGIALAPNGDLVISTNHAIVRAVKP